MTQGAAHQSLAGKLLLFAFGSTLIGALVISWVAIDSTRLSLQESVERAHPAALVRAATMTRHWLGHGQDTARDAAAGIGPATSIGALQRHVRDSDVIRSLAWITPEVASSRASDGLTQELAGAGLREIAAREAASILPLTLGAGESVLAVWLPAAGGGVLAVLDHQAFGESMAHQLPHPASAFCLTDTAGRTLLRVPGPEAAAVGPVDLSRLRDAPGTLRQYSVEGRSLLGAALPLHVDGLQLALQTPVDAAHAPIHALVKRILGVAAATILLVSLLAYGLSARALRPIEALSRAARQVAAGNTDVELPQIHSRDEVGALTRTVSEMIHEIRMHRQQLEEANQDLLDRNARLESMNEVLSQLSITDGLTQLHNHRFFQDHLTREIKRVTRNGEALSMLVIDIDDFKKLNDRHGHASGDEVLRRIARLLEDNVRESDLLARYGGEEFVIVACNTELEGASVLAEKVRTAIAENSFIVDESLRPVRITVSVGVAQYSGNRKRFFAQADDALYRAKAAGKNCVIVAD